MSNNRPADQRCRTCGGPVDEDGLSPLGRVWTVEELEHHLFAVIRILIENLDDVLGPGYGRADLAADATLPWPVIRSMLYEGARGLAHRAAQPGWPTPPEDKDKEEGDEAV
jgi:hypothetical protein